jgi:predicted negative regulator of RcsB-dependent stress response
LDINRTEQEQIESLKNWWEENGKSVIAGIVIGLGAVFGWRGWQAYIIEQAEAASEIYTDMILEVRQQKNDKAREYGGRLLADYPSTAYAVFAAFVLAKLDVEDNKMESALNHLQWIMGNTDQDELMHLARLRMARILLDDNKPDEALALLEVKNEGEFMAGYAELRGDIYMSLGKPDAAHSAYQQALTNTTGPVSDFSPLHMKLDDIGQHNPQ